MYVFIAYLLGILTGIKQIHPVNEAKKSQEQAGNSLPVLRPELNVPATVETKTEPKDRKKYAFDLYMAFIHTLTMAAVVWYAIINSHMLDKLKESTKASQDSAAAAQLAITLGKEQFQKDQRPYIWVTLTKPMPMAPNKPLKTEVFFANYGKSPAIRETGSGMVFFGKDALRQADEWFINFNSMGRSVSGSQSITPPGIPADPGKGYYSTVASIGKPSDKEIDEIVSHDNYAVVVSRIEYFDTAGNYYLSDICFTRIKDGTLVHCHTHNEIK